MTAERRDDAFSRFNWIPALLVGIVAAATQMPFWIAATLGLASFGALLALDRVHVARGRRGPDDRH